MSENTGIFVKDSFCIVLLRPLVRFALNLYVEETRSDRMSSISYMNFDIPNYGQSAESALDFKHSRMFQKLFDSLNVENIAI